MEFHPYLRGLGLAVAGAAFWFLYFDLKDRLQPEPRRRLFTAFLWGAASALLAVGTFRVLGHVGLPRPGHGPLADTAILCFGFIGPIEEACKAIPFLVFVLRFPEFDERVDGVIYAAALAIGFAAFETLLYVPHVPLVDQIARAFAAPLTHSIFAAIWGYGFGRARLEATTASRRIAWYVLPFLAAALAHGAYDFVLLAWNATLLASGIALVLWLSVLHTVRHAVTGSLPASAGSPGNTPVASSCRPVRPPPRTTTPAGENPEVDTGKPEGTRRAAR
jgi:RsiW-degrading membrane proteinase PrsW (M82 family)